ncbi:MAG: hypothetical protein AB3N20_03930 [Rhizobiaceae bacterium]
MRKLLVTMCVITLTSTASHAISRHNSQSLSCDSIHAIIEAEGAAIMRYQSRRNPGLTLFDRYVRNGAFCDTEKYPVAASIPAADTDRCVVYRCIDRSSVGR